MDSRLLPQVGDWIWATTHYRKIVEVVETMEDGRLKIRAFDPRTECVVTMAVSMKEPRKKKTKGPTRQRGDKPVMTPEMRQKIEDKLACRSRGHDLTGTMPNGKPVLYLGPKGQQACRMCKQEAVERYIAKRSADEVQGRSRAREGAVETAPQ